jgi:hypothetical protein
LTDYTLNLHRKTIKYSNSKQTAEEALVMMGQSVISKVVLRVK